MYKFFLMLMFCFCLIISGCASKGLDSTASATFENPMQVPLERGQERLSVYVQSKNSTRASLDLSGMVLALLQSEYGMRQADNALSADYLINLHVTNFVPAGVVEAPLDTGDVALPVLLGTASGAQVGSSIDGWEGAAWGAGVGAALGLGIAVFTADDEYNVWKSVIEVDIKDKHAEQFTSRINATVQGVDMNAAEASAALENDVAWTIVRAFK